MKAQDATTWDYSYNDRSELLTGVRKLPTAQPLAGQQYTYTYDNLGNITQKQTGGDAAGANLRTQASPANTLNQYATYQTPSSFDVLGQAPAGSTVTVNGIAATFQDTFFRANVATANTGANGIWQSVAITNAGVTTTGNLYVPPASFTPTYDLDGNLTDDGEWTYLWDAENRMKAATRAARAVTAGAPYRRYEHTYDAMSRLVQTKTFATAGTTVLKTEQYIYNGWNRVAMLESAGTATPALRQSYAWGLDISAQNGNSGQDSGSIGALLVVRDTQLGSHCPCYDSNGNIIAMVNAATKAISAQYGYSPFGETTRATGPFAEANPYRFSTKPTDSDTGLIYYGYRFYKPKWQTWPSRDPIGEETFRRQYSRGKSISERKRIAEAALAPAYVFVENQPVHSIDYLGLDRYITQFDLFDAGGSGGSQIHVGVAVDKWKIENGKYVKDGQVTFDFAADFLGEGLGEEDIIDEDQSIAWGNIDWWNIITSSIKGRGRIAKSDGLTLKAPITVPSSPCQDIKMLELLEKDLANPPFYSAIAHNCLFWAVGALQYGMDKPEIGKCCNPDGTIFTP